MPVTVSVLPSTWKWTSSPASSMPYPLRVVLVGGTGVVFEHTPQAVPLVCRDPGPERLRAGDVQMVELRLRRKACSCIRVAVGIGNVGLDVVDGGAVHQVGSPHDEHRADFRPNLNGFQFHAGQPQRVGPERRPGGEDAHPGVAAQPRRPDGGGPAVPHGTRKLPHQPDVAEIFQPAHSVRAAVFGRENDLAPQAVHQPALPRDAEFGGEGRVDVCDDLQGHGLVGWLVHRGHLLIKMEKSS